MGAQGRRLSRCTRRLVATSLLALAAVAPAEAGADFDTCVYDAGSKTVTATLTVSTEGRLYVASGGAIASGFDDVTGTPCGAATTANTDRIDVRGRETTLPENATIDNSGPGGPFRKAGGEEILVDVNLGETPWTYDPQPAGNRTLRIVGTTGDDEMRAGKLNALLQGGVNIDAQSDADVDVQTTNVAILDLDGGDGDDHVTGLGGTGTVEQYHGMLTLRGGAGDDLLVGNNRGNVIYPGSGGDEVDGMSPDQECPCTNVYDLDVVSYEDAPNPVRINFPHTFENDDGWGFNDDYEGVEGIRGSGHADVLTNTSVPGRYLDGAGGDDEVNGGYNEDSLFGGDGNDHLTADPGASFRSEYADDLFGGPGNDTLDGGQDPDALHGGEGNDVLNAGLELGAEYEYAKRNGLIGGPGSDVMNGSHGDDAYEFDPPVGDEVDTIHELPRGGRDTIYAAWGEPAFDEPITDHVLDLSSKTVELGTGGTRTFRVAAPGEAANLEGVQTGWGADDVTGNVAVNDIRTGPGDDEVFTRDEVADTVNCSYDNSGNHDVAIVDHLDVVDDCETVHRSGAPVTPPFEPRLWVRYGAARFDLRLPQACVSAAQPGRIRLLRKIVREGSLHAKIVRATFWVDGKWVATNDRKPFGIDAPHALAAGRHRVIVRLLLRPLRRRGDQVELGSLKRRVLRGTFAVCG